MKYRLKQRYRDAEKYDGSRDSVDKISRWLCAKGKTMVSEIKVEGIKYLKIEHCSEIIFVPVNCYVYFDEFTLALSYEESHWFEGQWEEDLI